MAKNKPKGKRGGGSANTPRPAASRPDPFRRSWLAPVLLGVLTIGVYFRSLWVPIHDWDDYIYYYRDVRLDHLTGDNLWKILTQPFFANFHPLTTLTYAFDRTVWGAWTPGYHITQLFFYVGGVIGLYFFFARVLNWRAAAFLAAALFAVHTIHVESVAWLASRKDVVCLFFYAFSLWSYSSYSDATKGGWRKYVLTLILSAAAIFSKGYAVILPGVFLAYDFCLKGRVAWRQILEKVPFAILAGLGVWLTVHAQDKDSAIIQSSFSLAQRAALLGKIFGLYVGRTILPVRLSAFYTVAGEPVEAGVAFMGLLLAAALVACVFFLRRSKPVVAFGIALFLLPLATVMNLFFTLRIWMTDRYLFFPTIGASLALVGLGTYYVRPRAGDGRKREGGGSGARAFAVVALLVIALYSAMTVARIGTWTSSIALWSDVLRKDLGLPGSGPVRAADLQGAPHLDLVASGPLMGLVHAYMWSGNQAEADAISKAISGGATGATTEDTQMAEAQKAFNEGRLEDALKGFQALSVGKTWLVPLATVWTGVVEKWMGRDEDSRRSIQLGIDRYHRTGQPATEGLITAGTAAFTKRNYPQAVEWYRMAQQESPTEAKTAFHLGRAMEEAGDVNGAMVLYKRVARGELTLLADSQFTLIDVYLQMAVAAQKLEHYDEARGYFEEVLRRAPNHPKRAAIQAEIDTLRVKAGKKP